MPQLREEFRPKRWNDVIGQDKVIEKIRTIARRGLSGRAFWISGPSGAGKSSIGRLIAAEVADEFCTQEIDATDLAPAALRDLEQSMRCRGFGDSGKTGRAYLVNEAHGLRKDDVPCRAWSWSNQLITALHGHADARGFRQWQEVGRHVKKGERGFPILVPITKRFEQTDAKTGEKSERIAVVGFKHAIVFGLLQTDGEPLPPQDPDVCQWIESRPFRLVSVDGS